MQWVRPFDVGTYHMYLFVLKYCLLLTSAAYIQVQIKLDFISRVELQKTDVRLLIDSVS